MNAKISKAGGPSYEGVDGNDDAGVFPTGRAGESTESDTQSTTVDTDQDRPAEGRDDGNDYDPGDYTVTEVNAYLDDCRDEGNQAEYDRVLAEERGGKARAGILNRGSGG